MQLFISGLQMRHVELGRHHHHLKALGWPRRAATIMTQARVISNKNLVTEF